MASPEQDHSGTVADNKAVDLPAAARSVLDAARAAPAGRAGRTLTPGAGIPLKQSLLALTAGQSLAEHESPSAATLQVLIGRVRLTFSGQAVELAAGELGAIPPFRHGLDAVEDAVVMITVAASAPGSASEN